MSGELRWDPGWFADPTGRHDHRWWDGAAWTGHVADAGVAGKDPLDARPRERDATASGPEDSGPAERTRGPVADGAARSTVDPVAILALILAIIALLIALLPVVGIVPATAAVIVAVIARARVRRSGRRGEGVAIAGLVIAIGALIVAVLVTIVAFSVFGGTGGELQEALRAYADCLEVESQATCRARLEQDLSRMVR